MKLHAVLTVSVVICAYTERRWQLLLQAVHSLRSQRRYPDQCIVVIDHNEQLLLRARSSLPDDVEIVPNGECAGLSGARNTGVRAARGDVVAFLDDDAEADAGWLEELLGQYEVPSVVGAGGMAVAVWPGTRPAWLPTEFDWVVGCSYTGLPERIAPVRNLLGASMSLRRCLFEQFGTFDTEMGRQGALPLGCEETEFAIRVRHGIPGAEFMHVPNAVVQHHIEPERTGIEYFFRRCYSEGLSKAVVTRRSGATAALSAERSYVISTLSRGILRGIGDGFQGDVNGFARSAMILAGLATTTAGYLVGIKSFRS
ncbi:MAG: glycosyltransferase family 2 protein [Acidimicrobiales bacterium]